MASYVVLEGFVLYFFMIFFLLLAVACLIGLISAISSDAKNDKLKQALYQERAKNIGLYRDNMRLKLKCGELRVGEKVDV